MDAQFEEYIEKNDFVLTFDSETGEDALICNGAILHYTKWLERLNNSSEKQ